ncbi:hypothetical protein JW905_10330, partial [bacterium]|nr:hypothetical protein [candidate division CSSED10-310 bacterium]
AIGILVSVTASDIAIRGATRHWAWIVIAAAGYTAALLCKENAVVMVVGFPLTLLLIREATGRNQQHSAGARRPVIISTAVLVVSTCWLVMYLKGDYGVRFGYMIASSANPKDLLLSIGTALPIYLGAILFHLNVTEISKAGMFSTYMPLTILLVFLGAALLTLLILLNRRVALPLLALMLLWIVPATLFWVNDRLIFGATLWFALLVGMGCSKLVQRRSRRSIIAVILLATWYIGGGSIVSVSRAMVRNQWCETFQDRLVETTAALLEDYPATRTVFFLNLPDPRLAIAIDDNLRWNLARDDLHAYPLTFFAPPPLIMHKGKGRFMLRSVITGMTEPVLAWFDLYMRAFKPGSTFQLRDFEAIVASRPADRIVELEFQFPEPLWSDHYLFVVWGGSPPVALKYEF